MKIVSSFTDSHAVPDVYDFLLMTTNKDLKKILNLCESIMQLKDWTQLKITSFYRI